MAVMPAHMPHPIAGFKFQVIFFPDRKCVHVCSQKNARASLPDHRGHACRFLHPRKSGLDKILRHLFRYVSPALLPRYSHLIQTLPDISARLRQIHADLRYLMEVSPILHDLRSDAVRHTPYAVRSLVHFFLLLSAYFTKFRSFSLCKKKNSGADASSLGVSYYIIITKDA